MSSSKSETSTYKSATDWDIYLWPVMNMLTTMSIEVITDIATALKQMGMVYVLGNGGSQANASHLSLHLQEVGVRARDLHAELPLLTAWSNDHDYSTVALNSLRRYAQIGDALVVVSGSGDSPNILVALAESRRIGIRTIGLLGFGGGAARSLCDLAIILPSHEYGPVEDVHSVIIHYLKTLLLTSKGKVI